MAELSFRIPHMNSGASATAVTAALRKLEGITRVEIDLHTKWVLVTGNRIDTEAIRRAVHEAGYAPEL